MAYTPYTSWGASGGSSDIGGLNDNLINALTGSGAGAGLAKEATLIEVRDNLETAGSSAAELLLSIKTALLASSDGESAADILEDILTQEALNATILANIETAVESGSNYVNRTNWVSGDSGAITTTSAAQLIAAPGASTYIYITSVLVTNSSSTVGTLVSLRDSDGTAIPGATGYAGVNGGYSITFPTPLKMPAANKALQAICGTTGANVYVSVAGYKGA